MHQITDNDSAQSDDEYIQAVSTKNANKFWVTPKINGKQVKMEIDTGSGVSILPQREFHALFPDHKLKQSDRILRTYTHEMIHTLGMMECDVRIHGQRRRLTLYITETGTNALFGRQWLRALQLNWAEIKAIHTAAMIDDHTTPTLPQLRTIIDKHSPVFEPGYGNFKGTNAKFYLQHDAQPKFMKARNVPYALRPKVEEELDKLEKAGIISPVTFSEWASPICCVPKPNGQVRICGDFKATLNPQLIPEQHPMQKVEDVFATLAGGEKFTKLDLTQAYLTINLHPDHRKYVTINTHKGLYQYNRVPYGVTDSGAKYQKPIDQLLMGAKGTQCIVDDVIITGQNDAEHLQNLDEVLRRLHEHGLKVNRNKCRFMENSITFCGHVITREGIKQESSKRRAITDAPTPTNHHELSSLIGLIGFYRKFVPNVSTVMKPLTELQHAKEWTWGRSHDDALHRVKKEIASDRVLTHYDPTLPLQVAVDASPVGLGCVMSHKMPDNTTRPVLFLSRTLTDAEKKYSHLHKEALGIYWAVRKLYHYLYGRHFTLITDNKPLAAIFHPDKNIPEYSALRLQRYAIFLSGLNYTVETRPTKLHGDCDALSRLPLPDKPDDHNDDNFMYNVKQLDAIPVVASDVAHHTKKDKILSRVYTFVQSGTWDDDKGEFEPYYRKRNELSTQQHILFWQNRIIVPPPLRKQLLDELHVGHPGIVRMKAIARSYIWYPHLDKDIEDHVRNCLPCAQHQPTPPECQLQNWRYPSQPMDRVHIDFAGPIEGKQLLIIVDAHSKWPHVEILNSTASDGVIEKLRSFCATFGIMKTLVSDNATCFTSETFKKFCQMNGIRHITGAVYHSKTNGQAEIVVKQVKNALKSLTKSTNTLRHRLDEFLFRYRATPHSTTGETPSILMLNRQLRTRLDLIRPSLRHTVEENQSRSKKNDYKLREFNHGDTVMMRDYAQRRETPWIAAKVLKKTGPVSYQVATNDRTYRRHADQLTSTRITRASTPPPINFEDITTDPTTHDTTNPPADSPSDGATGTPPAKELTPAPPPTLRRSSRATQHVQRYGESVPWSALKK